MLNTWRRERTGAQERYRRGGGSERVAQAGEDVDRRCRRQEAYDGRPLQARVGGEGAVRLVSVVEGVVDVREGLETTPSGRQADVRHPVGRQRSLRVGVVAPEEL